MAIRRRRRDEDDEPIGSDSWDDPQPDDDPVDDEPEDEDDGPDDEPEDDEDEEEPEFEPETQLSPRRQRRAERGRIREENERMRQELADLQRQNAQIQGALQQFTYSQQARGYQQPPPPQENPHDREIADLDKQFEMVSNQFATLQPGQDDKLNQLRKELRQLETKKIAAVFKQTQYENRGSQQPQLTPQQLANVVIRQQLEAENPDIYGDQRHKAVAGGIYEAMVLRGAPENRETHDRALEEARKQLGLKTRTESRPRERSPGARTRMSGVRRGAAGGGSGGGGSISRTPELQQIANSWARSHGMTDLSEKKVFQKWVNGPGRSMIRDSKS